MEIRRRYPGFDPTLWFSGVLFSRGDLCCHGPQYYHRLYRDYCHRSDSFFKTVGGGVLALIDFPSLPFVPWVANMTKDETVNAIPISSSSDAGTRTYFKSIIDAIAQIQQLARHGEIGL